MSNHLHSSIKSATNLEPSEDKPYDRRNRWTFKAAVILVLLLFTVVSLPNLSFLLNDRWGFLSQNRSLQSDPIVQMSEAAIVSIEAVTDQNPLQIVARRGTGFNIESSGLIVTNKHVLAGADTIIVTFGNGQKFYARNYQTIAGADVALVALNGKNLPYLSVNRQKPVEPGDVVTIIGNPLGLEKIAQRGEVGGYYRYVDGQPWIFDIKLQINPGNSGSPVLDGDSQVVGIIYASTSLINEGQTESRALAIPAQVLSLPSMR